MTIIVLLPHTTLNLESIPNKNLRDQISDESVIDACSLAKSHGLTNALDWSFMIQDRVLRRNIPTFFEPVTHNGCETVYVTCNGTVVRT